ncbi:hypothetical protein GCM10022291_32540 [Postechiella marina]|uniref:Lipoprotein n=1 Tax=Postechiella marina TaxID=943941 RepID=A0ABP8CH12_9FLAO
MKNLKRITAILLMSLIGFTSCQDDDDAVVEQNPDANSSNSQTAQNIERSSMYNGSFDDFLDGVSCSSILLPVTATVNGTDVNVASEADYQTVIDILTEYNNDEDTIVLHFPLTIKISNYTQVQIVNQTEYDVILSACSQIENVAESAINCLDIDFPITIVTYNVNFEQTGSIVLESNQELYTYINELGNDQLFAINYPITATLAGENTINIASDLDLQTQITACLGIEDQKEEAKENAKALETILVEGAFKVESFIYEGAEKAEDYANYTIDFAGDLTCEAENTTLTGMDTVQGTYGVTSEIEVNINLSFSGNASFELLNNSWEIASYSQSSISLKSTTDAAVTIVLAQI